jgi:hypothetical protein
MKRFDAYRDSFRSQTGALEVALCAEGGKTWRPLAMSLLSNIYTRYRHSQSGAAALSLVCNRLSA